jgi:hypothetical protein
MNARDRTAIERACERVVLDASYALDIRDIELVALSFTEDCIFVRPSTYPGRPIAGRQQLIEIIRARDPRYVGRHVISNIRVSAVSRTEATASSLFCNFAGTVDPEIGASVTIGEALRSVGEYEDYVVLRDKRWQIRQRVGRFILGAKFSP